jgi:hypothetical protein
MALYDFALRFPEKGMRVLRFPLTRLILALVFFAVFVFGGIVLKDIILNIINIADGSTAGKAVQMVCLSAFAWVGYWVYCSLVEGRAVYEMDKKKLVRQTLYGLLLGFGFISAILLIIWLSGGYLVKGFNPFIAMVPVLIMSVQAGIMEEILTRGMLFRIMEEGIGTWLAVTVSALIFGFMHMWNANATVFSSISIALTAGVILAMLYVITRQLWIPIGLHIGWNFTLGGIYGAPVSGGDAVGLLKAEFPGPDWLTGGSFGPEASVVTVAVFIVFGAFLVRKSIIDQSFIKPMRRKKHDQD